MGNSTGRSSNAGCPQARARALEAIILSPGGSIPEGAADHIGSCPDCREAISGVERMDMTLSGALRRIRTGIPRPSTEDIDLILAAARITPPAAGLLRDIRRAVNRMLLLTLLVLSFLALCGLGWILVLAWKAAHGG